ncbi:MAG: Trk system potassium transporter TrkA [bacterium]|uniref:Trk system potassium uptake protein TrkA n=1 Tax=Candidatus Infernicultor aquiphilus TaxID=1805029 RepID=A0A2M7K6E3_9BACT|nr:Trk system potassium transporter TrkA [bacterium]PIX33709.1 MAG: Trk system potassium transporter TrkA [Candidatus Atribacteria bacterium CG_4_8_14_3_um_filter_34_18]
MKIIVIGAGKVGCQIAQTLSSENHDIVIIEKDNIIQQSAQNSLDAMVILGNGANVLTLEEAGIKQTDMLIAVTSSDEVNMLACMIAKQFGVPKKIARIRNPEYLHTSILSREKLGIDFAINPERATAKEIVKLFKSPINVSQVQDFAEGKVKLIEFNIEKYFPFLNQQLKNISFKYPVLVAAIYRDNKIIIPDGEEKIILGDNLYVLVEKDNFLGLNEFFNEKPLDMQNVMILGGNRIAIQTALILAKLGINTKLIERDKEKCDKIAELLPHSLIINGDGTNIDLLKSEGIKTTDGFVAVTGYDEYNLLVALLAKHLGTKKVIAKIDRSNYIPILEKIGVDAVVNPRIITTSAILQFIRKGEIVSLTLLKEGKAEVIELMVHSNSKIINKPLRNANLPKNSIIGAVIRKDRVIIPHGDDTIQAQDKIIIFALSSAIKKIEKIFDGEKS